MTIGAKCYITAGQNSSGTRIDNNEEYDPVGDSWAAKAAVPSPLRYDHASIGLSGKGYFFSGNSEITGPFPWTVPDTDEYDPSGDSWASMASAPSPSRFGAATFEISGKAYLCGGNDDSSSRHSIPDVDEYAVDTWTSRSNLPISGAMHWAGASIDGRGHVAGGSAQSVGDFERTTGMNYIMFYEVDTWTGEFTFPDPTRCQYGAGAI
jgi:hypothetical protein